MKSPVHFSLGLITALLTVLVSSAPIAARAQCCAGLDPDHDPGGGTDLDGVYASVRQSDGKIIIGGAFTYYNLYPCNNIARLTPTGENDSYSASVNGPVYGLALDGAGRLVAVGAFTSPRVAIARFLTDGQPDPDFNPPAIDYHPYTVAVAPWDNNKILVGGPHTYIGGIYRPRIARLLETGGIDSTFNASNIDCAVHTINVQEAYWIGGAFTTVGGLARGGIARLNTANGNVDSTWPADSENTLANGPVYAIELDQSLGRVIGGAFTHVNGQLSKNLATLNYQGVVTPAVDSPNGAVRAVKLLVNSGDQMAIGGDFTTVGGTTCRGFARMNAGMSVACAANPGFQGGTPGTSVKTLITVLQEDFFSYRVFAAGNFTTFNGTSRNHVAQLCLPCCPE